MTTIERLMYDWLDAPEISLTLFHPRPEWPGLTPPSSGEDLMIPVGEGVAVGARFFRYGETAPTLLFFHGNGEIVADYDELGPVYNKLELNFLPVDYRGYGRSGGRPSASALLADSHAVLDFVVPWLTQQGCRGPLIVMGRSLGSAPAVELAWRRPDLVDGLIVESGFARTGPLLAVLGIMPREPFDETRGFRNLDKMGMVTVPTLIIHAQNDRVIPVSEAQALFTACPADRSLLIVPGATHNDLLAVGQERYLTAVRDFSRRIAGE